MLIDFHTHTRASDGALDPGELLDRARDGGVRMLAITDHDTVKGYQAARESSGGDAGGLQLIPGVELSCLWSGTTIHILGLGIECQHPVMVQGMHAMAEIRQLRGEEIARRLEKRGMEGALAGALQKAGASQLGRPHFADWMVERGHARDHNQAFDRYLGQGKIGDVKACWPSLGEVVRWITASGGVAVVAHPLKYRFTGMKLRRLLTDFVAAGGEAVEVKSGNQTPDQLRTLGRLAEEFDLEISVGSDFHRDTDYGPRLGVDTDGFEHSRGVWRRWEPMQESAERS